MNRQRQVALAIVLAGAALLYLQVAHRRQIVRPFGASHVAEANPSDLQTRRLIPAPHIPTSAVPMGAEEPAPSEAIASARPFQPTTPTAAAPVADTPEATRLPPATILENMRTAVRQYGATFGENPVGTNPEITAALQGDNPRHINFLKPDGNRVNSKGELVDAWGTPYFFHQISGHEMEIRSAGPDRVMYTSDDLVTR